MADNQVFASVKSYLDMGESKANVPWSTVSDLDLATRVPRHAQSSVARRALFPDPPAAAASSSSSAPAAVTGPEYACSYRNKDNLCYLNALWFLLQRLAPFRAELEAQAARPADHCNTVLGGVWKMCMRIADVANYYDAQGMPRQAAKEYDTAQDLLFLGLLQSNLPGEAQLFSRNKQYSAVEAFYRTVAFRTPANHFGTFSVSQRLTRECKRCTYRSEHTTNEVPLYFAFNCLTLTFHYVLAVISGLGTNAHRGSG
jgi:hypothetical protein